MARPAPTWMGVGWLPTLEIVEWERLDLLREEHERLVNAHRRPSAGRLRHSFEVEDEFVEEAERAGTTTTREITPPTVRRDKLEAAEAADADALRLLCAHVGRAALELHRDDDDRREAIDVARAKAGFVDEEEFEGVPMIGPAATPKANPFTEPELNRHERIGGAADQVNGAADAVRSRRTDMAARYWRQRQAFGKDCETLATLLSVRLSAHGANILIEVEEACPGATVGLDGGMASVGTQVARMGAA